jgi:hypothetical protein
MAAGRKPFHIEIAVGADGAIFAYDDTVLDRVAGLRLRHSDGALTALSADASREFPCGHVSAAMTRALGGLGSAVWARFAVEDRKRIAVAEVGLEHI